MNFSIQIYFDIGMIPKNIGAADYDLWFKNLGGRGIKPKFRNYSITRPCCFYKQAFNHKITTVPG